MKVLITNNNDDLSVKISKTLSENLLKNNIEIEKIITISKSDFYNFSPEKLSSEISYIICIGGDGSFLRTLHKLNFPDIKIAGINTGHLGFFQEFSTDDISTFAEKLKSEEFFISEYMPITVEISGENKKCFKCLNEIVIKGSHESAAVLDLKIDNIKLESFFGDGLVVSTPAGSTAYNYALSGSIIDHKLNVLQITPIAPIKSAEFSSFTSSIVISPEKPISISPENIKSRELNISADGIEILKDEKNINEISISLSTNPIKVLRIKNYNFWDKANKKLL